VTLIANRNLAHRIRRRQLQRRAVRAARELVRQAQLEAELGPPGPFLDFIPAISPRLRRPDHLSDFAESIERGITFDGGPGVRDFFSYPVRHNKTTTIRHAIPYILRHDPTRAILYLTYAHGFAAKQTDAAKDLALRAGIRLGRVRRRSEWTTAEGGLVKGVGIGGQVTGEGFTDIFIDDPHKNRAEAESRVIREGVIEATYNDVFTRLDPRGTNIWIAHARWNVNDLGGVVTRHEGRRFRHVNRPALDDDGNPLAPWLFSREQLEELRAMLGPYVFESLYQGRPRPRAGALFRDPTYTSERRVPKNYRIAIGLDLAWSGRTRSDHNAAVVLRKDLDRKLFDMLEAVRARGLVMDHVHERRVVDEGFARQVVRLLNEYPEAVLYMYAAENEAPLVELLTRILLEIDPSLGRRARVTVLKIVKEKYGRAMSYARTWNAGRVRIPGRVALTVGSGENRREAPHLETEEEDEWRNRDGWQHGTVVEHIEFTGVDGEENDRVDAAVAAHDGLDENANSTSMVEALASMRF
jgi:hypothetical protein